MIIKPVRLKTLQTAAFCISIGAAAILFSSALFANPVVDNIAAGQVSIEQTPNTTTVNQTSQKAIINWQSFNIAAPETTHFQQPAGGVALNRINPTQGPSQIYGRLTATGQIILVNPAGFYFGPGSFVNVGGIIASTADISNEDFLNNYYRFSNSSAFNGAIVTKGQIIAADNGLVALIGGAVSNDGMIQANMGYIVLASGTAFTMTFAGNDLIGFAVDSGVTKRAVDHHGNAMSDGVQHSGGLYADGGRILISAKTAAGILDNAINMSGIAQTKSIYKKDGSIILSSDPTAGKVSVSGKLIASGKNTGEKGGTIDISGYNILLASTSLLDVSGDVGSGNINIGGNYQGKGPLPNANAVAMESGAKIFADAVSSGNGGNVILWSDFFTSAHGSISAQGGAKSGDGGFVETSGKQYLDVNDIDINVSASAGLAGQWLLDPANLTIGNTNTAVTGISPFQPTGGSSSFLNVATLTAALLSGNVTVQTLSGVGSGDGDIIIDSAIAYSSAFSLTLSAFRHISSTLSNAVINNSGSGTVTLRADNSGTGTGSISLTGTTPNITASGGVNIYYNPSTFGTQDTLYSGGTTPTQYMLIQSLGTATDSATTNSLGALSNSANTSLWSQNFALAKNIDAAATSAWNSGAGFSPIGNNTTNFTGKFNGQNFSISNLFVTQPANQYIGMFGKTSSATLINNIIFNTPTITGRTYVGTLIGYSQGTVDNIVVNAGTVTGPTSGLSRTSYGGIIGEHYNQPLSNLTVNNMAISGRSYTGGIVGYEDSATMTNLHNNNSTVGGGNSAIGGIVGEMWGGSLTNASNTGNIGTSTQNASSIGGIAGDMYSGASITNAWNSGTINTNNGDFVGGITGYMAQASSITQSYNLGDVYAGCCAGGIAGAIDSAGTNITYSFNAGTVYSVTGEAGGIVGKLATGYVDHVYNTGNVVNTGTNLAPYWLGGIASWIDNGGDITNAYNTGYINGTVGGAVVDGIGGIVGYSYTVGVTLGNLFNTGFISGSVNAGALVGQMASGSPIFSGNLYWNSTTSGQSVGISNKSFAEVISKTANEMKQQATFSSFNFASGSANWNIIENTSYPFMRFFYPDPSTARVISGTTSESGGSSIALAYNGTEISTTTTGNDGSFYFFEGNNALSDATVIPDGSSLMIYFANSSNDANTIFNAPSSYGSVTDAALAVNSLTITGGTASNASLASLISGLSASDLLFSLSGNNLTLGTAANPNANLVVSASTTYDVNGNISSYSPTSGNDVTFNGPVTVSTDAVINLGTGDVTLASNVDGASALEITTSGNIVISGVIGDTTAPTSLEVKGGGNTTINAARITTAGSQTYRNPITFGANTIMTVGSGAYLGFSGGASGAAQTLTLAGSGSNTFTMNGGNYNFAAINVNGSGTGNTLYANSGAAQTWNISGANAGSIAAMNLAFSGIQSLTGTSSNNTFVFADGASLAGTIDGITSANTNTMNFTSYTTPIRIALNSTYSGHITNSSGNTIVNFSNMTNTINNTTANHSSIALPTGKPGTVNVTGKMVGYINDPFYFTNFQTLTGASGQNNTLAFNTTAIITSNTGNIITAIINGVTMTFENFTLGSSTTATPTTSEVASIVNEPTTNEDDNLDYSSIDSYTPTVMDMTVINETYTTPLYKTNTVKTGAACYGTY